jgi:hypothetical protein
LKIIIERLKWYCRTISVLLILALTVRGGERHEIAIPDIPGYTILKCDLHMHTVFSDGVVWPTVRVEEAWEDGLDAIAITDHIEYQPHKEYSLTDCNAPYRIAKNLADELGIILIQGGEITRGYPLMHGNAIFLKDVEALRVPDEREAYRKAIEQDAYIWWDHPGWRMPNEIPVWDSVHAAYYADGLIHGIEIVNEKSYYPLAFQWALEKNLTILGNSDVHSPIDALYNEEMGEHRPLTLIFVKKKKPEAIKEALIEHRTAVYHANTIFGREEFLRPMAKEIVQLAERKVRFFSDRHTSMQIKNNSCLDLVIEPARNDCIVKFQKTIIPARSIGLISISGDFKKLADEKVTIPILVDNFLIGPADTLSIEVEIKLVDGKAK